MPVTEQAHRTAALVWSFAWLWSKERERTDCGQGLAWLCVERGGMGFGGRQPDPRCQTCGRVFRAQVQATNCDHEQATGGALVGEG